MILPPRLRNTTLTLHIISSVGWLGAVTAFLTLAIAGLMSSDPTIVRGAYVSMELTGWYVIVPLSGAALVTGLVQSLGSKWGLFRHYWVIFKLLIAVVASVLLLLHMRPISYVAKVAATSTLSANELRGLRLQLVADAGAALLVLLVATVLSVFKPQGLTRYGYRKQRDDDRVKNVSRDRSL
jgi:hypothetical protein